jgi:hypothetical protein
LLSQTIRENKIALAVIAEPYRVTADANWAQDSSGMVAITWSLSTGPSGKVLDQGEGYTAVEWAGIAVVGVYVSPNSGVEAFEDFLDRVGSCIRRCLPRQALVLGDFNAHSVLWGNSRTTARGRRLLDWPASSGLVLVNTGSVQTCVAWRGTSVVDLTWATPGLHPKIKEWRVAEEAETLSDHLYVYMEVEPQQEDRTRGRRWTGLVLGCSRRHDRKNGRR